MYKVVGGNGKAVHNIASKENLISISTGIGNVQLLKFGENTVTGSALLSCVRTYDELAQFISLSRKYIYLNGSFIGTQIRDLETDHIIKEYRNHNRIPCNHRGNQIFLGSASFLNDHVMSAMNHSL